MASVFICRCHNEIKQGVRAPGGDSEWEIALSIDEAIRDVVYCGEHDPYRLGKTLGRRVKSINNMCKDPSIGIILPPYLAIETHCNWSSDPKREGFFVMAHKNSPKGKALARMITASMANLLGHEKNKGVNLVDEDEQWIETRHRYKAERQYFICKTKCPAVLVECCFLSNPDEAEWISKLDNRARLGKAIGVGIVEYLKGVDNEEIL